MVVFIYLAVKLSRHTLPANGYWAAVVLTVAANLYALAQAALSIVSGNFTPTEYALVLESLLLFMTEIVMLVVMCKLIFSLWSSFLQGRNRDPQSTGRHTSLGDTANQETALAPGGSLIVDFGSHRIEDHGYKADLRVNQSGNSQSLTIELSNDQQSWEACFLDEAIATDRDVPYLNSPWPYVRVTNSGSETTQIDEVFDLD